MSHSRSILLPLVLSLVLAASASGEDLGFERLKISGATLGLVTTQFTTLTSTPVSVPTVFGERQNAEAPFVPGLVAAGDLTGPGLLQPITLETTPGYAFEIPGLREKGEYELRNVRLMKDGQFLQYASPTAARITVDDLFQTEVKIRKLSPSEIRQLGISIDERNYDVYEYTLSFILDDGSRVDIPYPVIVDTRTGEIFTPEKTGGYNLPPENPILPPRWEPPRVRELELVPEGSLPEPQGPQPLDQSGPSRPTIPAAIVLPSDFAVLHDFFSVVLVVKNAASDSSGVTLNNVTATLEPSAGLRVHGSTPSVTFGSPVPIRHGDLTFIVAQAEGQAEWVVEGLKSGTHKLTIDIDATFKSPGQKDVPLRGTTSAAIHVHDPRFNITFSHPDVVREGDEYSAYAFVTNVTGTSKEITIRSGVDECSSLQVNICRVPGTPNEHTLTFENGPTEIIEYRLRAGATGSVFATAGTIDGDVVNAQVQLTMGVSAEGIPLSPTTLVMPHYARYLDQQFIADQLRLFGLGYSLAVAPLNTTTAKFPRVRRSEVFQRAVEIARAGEHHFLGEDLVDSFSHLTLDLLGNDNPLVEWDEFRRTQESGRSAAASFFRQVETGADDANLDYGTFAERFATVTAHREPYLLALVHGAPTGSRTTTGAVGRGSNERPPARRSERSNRRSCPGAGMGRALDPFSRRRH